MYCCCSADAHLLVEQWLPVVHHIVKDVSVYMCENSCLSCSVKASAAAASIRTEVAELARKADLMQVLLSNSIPVSMHSLESTEQVSSTLRIDTSNT